MSCRPRWVQLFTCQCLYLMNYFYGIYATSYSYQYSKLFIFRTYNFTFLCLYVALKCKKPNIFRSQGKFHRIHWHVVSKVKYDDFVICFWLERGAPLTHLNWSLNLLFEQLILTVFSTFAQVSLLLHLKIYINHWAIFLCKMPSFALTNVMCGRCQNAGSPYFSSGLSEVQREVSPEHMSMSLLEELYKQNYSYFILLFKQFASAI